MSFVQLDEPIAPWSSGSIVVVVQASRSSGSLHRWSLSTNDPDAPVIELSLTGSVTGAIVESSESAQEVRIELEAALDKPCVTSGEQVTGMVRLRVDGEARGLKAGDGIRTRKPVVTGLGEGLPSQVYQIRVDPTGLGGTLPVGSWVELPWELGLRSEIEKALGPAAKLVSLPPGEHRLRFVVRPEPERIWGLDRAALRPNCREVWGFSETTSEKIVLGVKAASDWEAARTTLKGEILKAIPSNASDRRGWLAECYAGLGFPLGDLTGFERVNGPVTVDPSGLRPFFVDFGSTTKLEAINASQSVNNLNVHGSFNVVLPPGGAAEVRRPKSPGVYRVYSDMHRKMMGWLLVR